MFYILDDQKLSHLVDTGKFDCKWNRDPTLFTQETFFNIFLKSFLFS